MIQYWLDYLRVLLVALGAAVAAVSLFAVGVRLLATPGPVAPVTDDPESTVPRALRPPAATVGAAAVFALAGGIAIAGVALIVIR